jgi:hypothetical protein
MRLILALALLAAPANAACQNDTEVFSCRIGQKTLEICHWKGALIYKFGPEAKPDLTIAEPLETALYTPWPGIGSSIWETVAFPNQGYTYEVWTAVERDPEATTGLEGGVTVLQGESIVAQLACDPGTPSNPLDMIFGLKESIGQCWDFDSRSWQTACN